MKGKNPELGTEVVVVRNADVGARKWRIDIVYTKEAERQMGNDVGQIG